MSIPEEKLIDLIKGLSKKDKKEAINFVERLNKKRNKKIIESFKNAPVDEEPLSDEFIKSLEEAENDPVRIPAEEVYKELGLL